MECHLKTRIRQTPFDATQLLGTLQYRDIAEMKLRGLRNFGENRRGITRNLEYFETPTRVKLRHATTLLNQYNLDTVLAPKDVRVDPSHRGSKYGHRLMQKLFDGYAHSGAAVILRAAPIDATAGTWGTSEYEAYWEDFGFQTLGGEIMWMLGG